MSVSFFLQTAATAPEESIPRFLEIVNSHQLNTDEFIRVKEQAIYKLGKVYVQLKKCDEIVQLLGSLRPFFAEIPKAKTAKITRALIDNVSKIPGTEKVCFALVQTTFLVRFTMFVC
jgi:26S proteasome regulatory subunit N6